MRLGARILVMGTLPNARHKEGVLVSDWRPAACHVLPDLLPLLTHLQGSSLSSAEASSWGLRQSHSFSGFSFPECVTGVITFPLPTSSGDWETLVR